MTETYSTQIVMRFAEPKDESYSYIRLALYKPLAQYSEGDKANMQRFYREVAKNSRSTHGWIARKNTVSAENIFM